MAALAVAVVYTFASIFNLWNQISNWIDVNIGIDLDGLTPSEKATAQGQLRLAVVQSLVAIGATVALFYTARTYRLTRRGQVTDRFTKALERLSSDKEYVRIGGILALGQILHDARDQSEDAQTVLQNYIREQVPQADEDWAASEEPTEGQMPEVQAAVDGLRKATEHAAYRLRLPHLYLATLDFREMQLVSADYKGSDLRKADLERANLWDALLDYTDLRLCDLRGTIFANASLRSVRLQYSRTENASFRGAFLKYAVFSQQGGDWATAHVDFRYANLTRASMWGMTFTDCDFSHADLTGATLRKASIENCRLFGADLTGAELQGADLTGAIGLKKSQLESAKTDEHTQLPSYLKAAAGAELASSPSPPD